VPLDQFKTQVLLLHSEQSTLDSLSSGFGDRYTVHCATSGSEALNTLVATPINVIITAQKLPGMSGLEALREAKKRSPETIGILLAGHADDGLEALVGDEEVFQVVRGNVTGDSLLKLVDNATRQMRLMALAESANDTAANPDDLTGEHIIMETSENGSTIISDGSMRVPALDPKKVGASTAVGTRSVDVLVLTKDQDFLRTIKESTRGAHTVHYANTLAQADETIRKQKVGVAVVDAAMVGQKVEQLTLHLRKGSPRLVSIVAGRRDDGEMLMDLINRGKVYRFLLKPVSPGRARLAVEASVKYHLEAPDAAFKSAAAAAPPGPAARTTSRVPASPPPKPVVPKPVAAKPASVIPERAKPAQTKPVSAPPASTQPKPQPRVASAAAGSAPRPAKPVAAPPAKPVAAPPKDPPLGSPDNPDVSPIDEGLASAFGGDDSGLGDTVTGFFGSIGKKFSGRAEAGTSKAAGTTGGGSRLLTPKVAGLAAVAVAAIAGGFYWFSGDTGNPAPADEPELGAVSITEADVDFGSPAATDMDADVSALIDEARLARDAGQIFNPLGSNAIELYVAALEADPSNDIATAELDAVIAEAFGMAETALLEDRLDDAGAALDRIALAQPGNPRLPFLRTQISQMQLRGYLTEARAAIRDTRFEDAANALTAARALDVPDLAEVDAVTEELSTARSEQRADEVLALANARLEEGDLLRPANDNARYYFDLVLSNDPNNVAARQGLGIIASKLVLQARARIDAGELDEAERLLGNARAIDPSNGELAATGTALVNARDAVAAERRAAEARRRAAEEQRAAEARAEAERLAAEARAAEEATARAEAEAAAARSADEPADEPADTPAEAPAGAGSTGIAKPPEAVAGQAGGTSADSGALATEPSSKAVEPAPPASRRDMTPIAVTSLNRTRYVAPKYPRAAQRRNQSGWVDVLFTVAVDGTVKDLEVRDSEPGDLFVNAALRAVEKWEFEPVVEDGVVVETRAGVRMMFALE